MNTNRLASELSPYLLQHKNNPVQWYPWSEEAFEAARKEDKPIFLSIGYATCYWCHVMEKDSFEIDEVAAILSRSFISIKVDREERPDIDQIYMDAVVGLTGHGGWPMSVFLTPDKKPFFGGTFFPRAKFINILEQISKGWRADRSAIVESATSITESLKERVLGRSDALISRDAPEEAVKRFLGTFDPRFGGFSTAPKFPPSQQIRLLFQVAKTKNEPRYLQPALFTLEAMGKGALFDHIEGGFHRYATDTKWEIPHFEKMLYDNALLVPAYIDAWLITKEKKYADIASRTCSYLINRMQHSDGGFYSAEDAGEVGKEGEFYVWNFPEIVSTLTPEELIKMQEVFTISPEGNFEGNNSLVIKNDLSQRVDPVIISAIAKLKMARDKRPRPFLDDKILTSWNGMVIGALAYAGSVLAEPTYTEAAVRCVRFIRSHLYSDKLRHRFREGKASIHGLLEDYVFLIEGLLHLYQSTFDEQYLLFAQQLQDEQHQYLWSSTQGLYITSSNSDVLFEKAEVLDGALPSCNSVALYNLRALAELFGRTDFMETADSIERSLSDASIRYPHAFPKALQTITEPLTLILGTGNGAKEKISSYIQSSYSSNRFFVYGIPASSQLPTLNARSVSTPTPLFYLCCNQTCSLPTTDIEMLRAF